MYWLLLLLEEEFEKLMLKFKLFIFKGNKVGNCFLLLKKVMVFLKFGMSKKIFCIIFKIFIAFFREKIGKFFVMFLIEKIMV